MRLKSYYKWKGYKRYGPYFVKYDENGESVHIGKEEYLKLSRALNDKKELEKKRRQLKEKKPGKYFSDDLREMFKVCGWKVRGKKITIDMKSFFTLETCSNRFALLDAESQKRIGSPARYLQLTNKAWKLHKKLNALKQANTLSICMAVVLEHEAL